MPNVLSYKNGSSRWGSPNGPPATAGSENSVRRFLQAYFLLEEQN